MATVYSTGAADPTSLPVDPVPTENAAGKIKSIQSVASIANGQAQNDLVVFGRIPSSARVHKGSTLYNDALTGLTSFSLGLFQPSSLNVPNTSLGSQACLISAADIHAAGSNTFAAISNTNVGVMAWQLAGLNDDPGGYLLVVGKIVAGPTSASGKLALSMSYSVV